MNNNFNNIFNGQARHEYHQLVKCLNQKNYDMLFSYLNNIKFKDSFYMNLFIDKIKKELIKKNSSLLNTITEHSFSGFNIFPELFSKNYNIMKILIEKEPKFISLCKNMNAFEYKDLLNIAISKGYIISKFELMPEIASNYEIMKILISNDSSFIEFCSVDGIEEYQELLNIAINNGYNLNNYRSFSIPSNIKSNYEIMKLLINKNPNFIKQCTITDEKQYQVLFELACRSDKLSISYYDDIPASLTSNYEIMKLFINKDAKFINKCTITDPLIYKKLLDLAIENGYKFDYLTKLSEQVSSNYDVMKLLINKNPNFIEKCTITDIKQYQELLELAIKNGFHIDYEYLSFPYKIVSNFEIMKFLIFKNCNLFKLASFEKPEEYKELLEFAIQNGYDINNEYLKLPERFYSSYEIMKLLIEKNPKIVELCEINDEKLFTELMDLAIEKGYELNIRTYNSNITEKDNLFKYIIKKQIKDLYTSYKGTNEELILFVIKEFLKDSYIEEEKDNYLSYWNTFANLPIARERLFSIMTKDSIDLLNKLNMNFELFFSYTINSDLLDEYIKLLNNKENINKYILFYNNIKNNHYIDSSKSFGVDIILKLSRFFNRYPNIINQLISQEKELSESEVAIFNRLVNSEASYEDITSLSNLEQIELTKISEALNSENITSNELKDIILKFVIDIDLVECNNILEHYINLDTIQKMKQKAISKNDKKFFVEVQYLEILLKFIEETIYLTDDVKALKSILKCLTENPENVSKFRTLYYDLKEKIRNLYELDAECSLINIEDPNLSKTNYGDYEIIDLEGMDYGIYAHVIDLSKIETFFDKRLNKTVTICVSPISNYGEHYYKESGIIVGFTKIKSGALFASSNLNMGSDSFIGINNYEASTGLPVNYLTFEDTSKGLDGQNPETVLFREGLEPTCIVLRGDVPTEEELEAKRIIEAKLGHKIPFIHTKPLSNIENKNQEETTDLSSSNNKEDLEMLNQLLIKINELGLNLEEIYRVKEVQLGNSHSMYECRVRGKDGSYFIKPGYSKNMTIQPYRSYGMKAAYEVQRIINPNGAVYADVIQIDSNKVGAYGLGKIDCSVIKIIPDAKNITNQILKNIKGNELSSLLLESLVDYLIYNYDTKFENYIQSSGMIYGVDKEQTCAFIYHDNKLRNEDGSYKTDFNDFINYNPNCVNLLYPELFKMIAKGEIELTQKNIEDIITAINNIESITDEEYIKIFENYINSWIMSHSEYMDPNNDQETEIERIKEQFINALLSRKQNLRYEFTIYLNNILEEYGKKKGVNVEEWKNMMNTQVRQMI